jgi:predicted Rossmann-fold nucleotide-binding protein
MLRKLPIVGIFGQGTALTAERARLAYDAGAMVAKLGAHLLTGAGFGVMAAAAEGFIAVADRPGLSIGIVPRHPAGAFDMPQRDRNGRVYPNPSVEIAIMTPLPPRAEDWHAKPSRNHINVLSVDAAVALPGNAGTRNELDMIAFYRGEADLVAQERRTVLLGPADEFTPITRELFVHAATLAQAEQHLRDVLVTRGFALPVRSEREPTF